MVSYRSEYRLDFPPLKQAQRRKGRLRKLGRRPRLRQPCERLRKHTALLLILYNFHFKDLLVHL